MQQTACRAVVRTSFRRLVEQDRPPRVTAFLEVRNTISGMTAQVAESVAGMAVIQAFNRERAFLGEFDKANIANLRTNQFAQWLNSLFFPAIEVFGIVAISSVLLVGGHLHDQGTLTVGKAAGTGGTTSTETTSTSKTRGY